MGIIKGISRNFKPFDNLTTYFSGAQYTTLSVVNSSIEVLKFEHADNEGLLTEDFSNNNLDNNEELFKPQAVISKLQDVIYNSL
ncbi:43064_t:CDS:2 [Gigaspora margarita]|uniref:43064_t:CDS:1 n=1 Tax=Gigaspora margarita TaxID=4874 RepID=A0ABN7VUC4_GIGMA|nr:43064_t:CDS:2 [Gigaspora margarita]